MFALNSGPEMPEEFAHYAGEFYDFCFQLVYYPFAFILGSLSVLLYSIIAALLTFCVSIFLKAYLD